MHDIKMFETDAPAIKKNLGKRKFDASVVDELIQLNIKRKEIVADVDNNRAQVKNLSKEIGPLKKAGKDATELMESVSRLKLIIEDEENNLKKIEDELHFKLSIIPNLLDESVPEGQDENSNVEVKKWGTKRTFNFKPKDHVELGENLSMLDFESGVKLTGSRFVVYKKDLARLERALINFMLDTHAKNGYEEIIPPYIVNKEALFGTGQLPKFEEDLFKLKLEDKEWYLIPTAEVPLTNLKKDELFKKEELPLKYCAYTPCFRSEAGSYGKDTKGLIRLHQFNKVEMVNIVAPNDSKKAHEEMVNSATHLLEELGLPYRSVLLCGGDIGFGAQKCFDLEVWLPGQDKYREISSISNCGDFQARRAMIRFRNDEGKPEFAHTLNGSGLAVGRTLVAIMENYQQEDGSIEIPKVLQPYLGNQSIIKSIVK